MTAAPGAHFINLEKKHWTYLEKRNAESVEHVGQLLLDGLRDELGEGLDPGLDDQVPVHAQRVHVQDAASGDRRRRGRLHILDFSIELSLEQPIPSHLRLKIKF